MTHSGAISTNGTRIVVWSLAALFVIMGLVAQVQAQTPGSGLASAYSANADKPIDIEADRLEVDDKKKIATFTGNVSATQGDFNLRAKEIQVKYTSKDDAAGSATTGGPVGPAGGNTDITQIDARGKVLVTTKNEQTATSDWAIFDVQKQLVTIGGNVRLSQGPNMIQGSRLVIDLNTGISRFETGAAQASGEQKKQRLKAIFTPKSRDDDSAGGAQ